jgi:hypothetical protein
MKRRGHERGADPALSQTLQVLVITHTSAGDDFHLWEMTGKLLTQVLGAETLPLSHPGQVQNDHSPNA